MTTSFLSPCSGELHGTDLQVLKDYALEAPWPWRKAFEALIARAEDSRELDELQSDNEALREVITDFVKETRLAVEVGDLKAVTESVDQAEAAANLVGSYTPKQPVRLAPHPDVLKKLEGR